MNCKHKLLCGWCEKFDKSCLEVVADTMNWIPIENGSPKEDGLYQTTITRLSDNYTWVQDLIYREYVDAWIWTDDPEESKIVTKDFRIDAWMPLPEKYIRTA